MKLLSNSARASLLCFAVFISLCLFGRAYVKNGYDPEIVIFWQAMIPLFFTFIYILLNRKLPRTTLRLRAFPMKRLPFTVLCTLTVTTGTVFFNLLLASAARSPESLSTPTVTLFPSASLLGVASTAVLPALCEELLFRGAILSTYEAKYGEAWAVFMSALFFAMMHSSLIYFPAPFFAGIIYALLSIKLNSAFPAMAAHLIHNMLVQWFGGFTYKLAAVGLLTFLTLASFLLFLILLYAALRMLERYIDSPEVVRYRGRVAVPLRRTASEIFLSPFFLIFAAAWAAYLFIF